MVAFRKALSTRLPDFRSILMVFSVICMIFYGWTIVSIIWKLGSWLTTLTTWEIFSLFSYLMVFNFLESVVILTGLLGLCLILPSAVLRGQFVTRGMIIVLCMLVSMMLHLFLHSGGLGMRLTFIASFKSWWLITLLLTAVLAWLLPKLHIAVRIFEEFADRATIFLFLLMPITVLGFAVIVFRFIFPN